MDDIIVNKVQSIQRCVKRAREEYAQTDDFLSDYTRQDAAILNVLRACEQKIDLASYVIRRRKLGVPSSSREAFALLRDAGLISSAPCDWLNRMIGFRNIAVHAYQTLGLAIVASVIQNDLNDLLAFADAIIVL
ncbi:MAG: DUF86 domain-containing protein [Anaerolineae bacterium]|nr:DUF86 domain-containing protein [Candidatus Roseilinea sp.]MDW8451104.1 DUF86 domain-containing protein [Anaerolineae bacterium]